MSHRCGRALVTGIAGLFACCGLPGAAEATGPFRTVVTVTNNSTVQFDDFHATFTGTGGSIKMAELKIDYMDGAGGAAMGMGNMVWVTWPAGNWVPAGGMFTFSFRTDHPEIAFNGASLTKNGVPVWNIDSNGNLLPERPGESIPVHVVTIPTPSALALLGAGCAVGVRRRR